MVRQIFLEVAHGDWHHLVGGVRKLCFNVNNAFCLGFSSSLLCIDLCTFQAAKRKFVEFVNLCVTIFMQPTDLDEVQHASKQRIPETNEMGMSLSEPRCGHWTIGLLYST